MGLPVTPQVLEHLRDQRHHAVFAALARTHDQLALRAEDVVHGQGKAFREPQPRAVDELYAARTLENGARPQPRAVDELDRDLVAPRSRIEPMRRTT
ncbi:MAG: hypothetical protein Fur0032_16550 [Terrimicrobiaceae bacterium]